MGHVLKFKIDDVVHYVHENRFKFGRVVSISFEQSDPSFDWANAGGAENENDREAYGVVAGVREVTYRPAKLLFHSREELVAFMSEDK